MKGYLVPVSCPVCGSELVHVTGGNPTLTEARAVVHCPTCNRDGVVCVTLVMAFQGEYARPGEPFPHGTEAGYNRHRRAQPGQPVVCEACRQAHSVYMKPKNAARKHRAKVDA